MDGKWLPLQDYCAYRGKSISTIRRYIKSNSVKYKLEDGKYYIWASLNLISKHESSSEKELLELKLENSALKKQLGHLQEKIDELNMLVQIYEQGDHNRANA